MDSPPAEARIHGRRLLAWWRGRRLDLAGLPRRPRAYAALALLTALGAASLIVALGAGAELPGGRVVLLPGEEVSRLALAFVVVAMGLAAAVLTAGSLEPGWPLPRLTRAAIAFTGIALGGAVAGLVETAAARALGWSTIGLSLLLAAVPVRLLRIRPSLGPLLAAAPFALTFVVLVAGGGTATLAAENAIATTAVSLSVAAGVLILWGALAAARQARDYGLVGARLVTRAGWLLLVLVAAKLAWLGLGYAETLPGWLDGRPETWEQSREDGIAGWLLALELALVVAALVIAGRPRRDATLAAGGPVAWAIVLALASPFLLGTLAGLGSEVLLPVSTGGARALGDLLDPLYSERAAQAAIAATVVLAVVLAVARRPLPGAARGLLAAFAGWGLVAGFGSGWQAVSGRPPSFHGPSVATLDAAVTLGIAAAAILWWAGRQRAVGPEALVVALVVFTLAAHPGFILPTGWKTGIVFYLALAYPVVWTFGFDAASLNAPGPDRAARVLRAAGLSALLLAVASLNVALEHTKPGATSALSAALGPTAQTFVLVPVAALLVAGVVRRRQAGSRA